MSEKENIEEKELTPDVWLDTLLELLDVEKVPVPVDIRPILRESMEKPVEMRDHYIRKRLEQYIEEGVLEQYLGELLDEFIPYLEEIDSNLDSNNFHPPQPLEGDDLDFGDIPDEDWGNPLYEENPFDDENENPEDVPEEEIRLGEYSPYLPDDPPSPGFTFKLRGSGFPAGSSTPKSPGFYVRPPGTRAVITSTITLWTGRIQRLGRWMYIYLSRWARIWRVPYFRAICYAVARYYVLFHEIGHYLVENVIVKFASTGTHFGAGVNPYDFYRKYLRGENARTKPGNSTSFEEAFVEAYAMSSCTRKSSWLDLEMIWARALGFPFLKLSKPTKTAIKKFNSFIIRILLYLLFRLRRHNPYAGYLNWLEDPWRFFLYQNDIRRFVKHRSFMKKKYALKMKIDLHPRAYAVLQFNFLLQAVHPGSAPSHRKQLANNFGRYVSRFKRGLHFPMHKLGQYEALLYRLFQEWLKKGGGTSIPTQVNWDLSLAPRVVKTRKKTWDLLKKKCWPTSKFPTIHGTGLTLQVNPQQYLLVPDKYINATDKDSFPLFQEQVIEKADFPILDSKRGIFYFKPKGWLSVPPPIFHFK